MDEQLHSPARLLIELRMEHAELNGRIDMLTATAPVDELSLRRLKKRRLALRDQIAALQLADEPDEPA
ncbi:YdcH family protein [Roseateles depolymerans]|nr:YdcH family protein [Roseateles depolymerans]